MVLCSTLRVAFYSTSDSIFVIRRVGGLSRNTQFLPIYFITISVFFTSAILLAYP